MFAANERMPKILKNRNGNTSVRLKGAVEPPFRHTSEAPFYSKNSTDGQ